MKEYLTIGDFARLRNVDRKSLRYYERIGALVPAYTDPQTKYRYYTVDQLVDLDTILVCLELGIPLKEASQYRSENGTLDIYRLFQDGKERLNEKLLRLQVTIKRLESSLNAMQKTDLPLHSCCEYERHLKKRYLVKRPLTKPDDERAFRQDAAELFDAAKANGLVPIFNFPVGLLAENYSDGVHLFATLELLPYEAENSEVTILPEGRYLCQENPDMDFYAPSNFCRDLFAQHPDAAFATISNITLQSYENGIFPWEVQIFLGNS